MARAPSRKTATELSPQADPRAALDGQELLKHAAPVLRRLEEDLLARARGSAAMTLALQGRYEEEKAAGRTAEPFELWQRAFVEQVAAAWLLGCVFVRTLEDRGLVGRARLAGPGALDSQRSFFELAPSLTERDYLLTVFRELEHFPAARDLFDARHNPLWLLGPSAEAAKALLALFRSPSAEAPAFRFGGSDTRFLGDLYQDLSEAVRKRYALLQTPHFVEAYILDHTLEPAITRFGLEPTTLIDPTCGSGHFLLGAFARLTEHKLRAEPGRSGREAAAWAVERVFGVDINPYAVAIARFRLTLAFLERAGYPRLSDAPAVHVHVAVADSLLENPDSPTFASLPGQRPEIWFGAEYSLEQPEEARAILAKRHAAVVGNPPYINVKDAALRKRYAERYPSCAMNYALTIPFCERFFQAARQGGQVGMITANSFMKREFGKRLIEQYLPSVNLERIVNTSGAFIPGHGTPTVLLFGTAEPKQGMDVLTVLASRGEPSTPDDPEQGLVWRSIADHGNEVGFENEFISVVRTDRKTLKKHPWSLGGGGAAELKDLLEERAEKRLADVVDDIGFSIIIGEDEVFIRPGSHHSCRELPSVPLVIGEEVRDWSLTTSLSILRPFDETTLAVESTPALLRALWPWRTTLENRVVSGSTTMKESKREWFDVRRLARDKHRWPLSITFAFVATHNHFVLDRGGKVFKQSAPIIKLPESATEDDHLALLAYLNSSTACFWMKQVMMNKAGSGIGRGIQDEEWECRFEFDGTKLGTVPLPAGWRTLAPLARVATAEREALDRMLPAALIGDWEAESAQPAVAPLGRPAEVQTSLARLVALQENIDWAVYRLFGLSADDSPESSERGSRLRRVSIGQDENGARSWQVLPGRRPFERLVDVHTTQWFARNAYWSPTDSDLDSPKDAAVVADRIESIRRSPHLQLIERFEYKRRWNVPNLGELERAALTGWALDAMERGCRQPAVVRLRELRAVAGLAGQGTAEALVAGLGRASTPLATVVRDLVVQEAVPFLAAFRLTDSGLEKHAEWERTWSLQRREDAGEAVGAIPVPPKYGSEDFATADIWRLRGKLDVPKERFFSYPGCESDEDKEPVYGWAGWDHLQRAQALAALYQDRKTREGWPRERLTPLLAGLLELIPWVKQWHNEPSADFGGLKLGDYFEAYLKGECVELGLTEDDLRSWRPPAKGRGAKTTAKAAAPKAEGPKKAPGRKRKAAPGETEREG